MRSRRTFATAPAPGGADAAVIEQISRALQQPVTPGESKRRRAGAWSPVTARTGVRIVAALFGVYLSYAVLRIQEVYPALDIPRLPMTMSIVITLVVLVSTPLEGWKLIWERLPAVRWEALIVALAFLTAPIGIWMSGSLTFAVTKYSLAVVVFVASIVLLRDRRALNVALWILLAVGTIVALYALSANARHVGRGDMRRVEVGVTLDPNDLAQIFVAMIPLALYMAQRKGARNFMWFGAAAALVWAIVPTQSRGAIVGMVFVGLVLLSSGTSRWRRVVNTIGVAVGAVGIVLATAGPGSEHLSSFSDYAGGESRTAIWKRGIVWITRRPWGYGIDNFPIYFGWLNGDERAAHNAYVQIGMELGVAGLAAFVMIWYVVIRTLLRQRAHAIQLAKRLPAAGREAILASNMLAAVVGTIVTSIFLAKAYDGITLFIQGLACAVILGYPYRDEWVPTIVPAPTTAALRRQRQATPTA